jgi:ABC-type antimicrobial peptide transport system permease subunit
VVRNSRQGSLDSGISDEVYLPMTTAREQPAMYALVRTQTTQSEAAAGLRRVVAGIDRLAPVTRVRTLDEVVAASVSASRSLTVLLLGFGALAVVIGAVGVYSLIAYMVSWRTREIGIRLALGARRWQIVSDIVKQSLLLAGGGSLAGLIVAIALTRLLHGFLFEVSAIDPLTFCAVPVVMMFVVLLAAGIPAWRAAALDPMRAIRAE